ncbi:MAG TPA: hypothetical protein VMF89_02890 [Polyangiales bacterium]|nr:hypothetical protein [Polyangiales bacterium]
MIGNHAELSKVAALCARNDPAATVAALRAQVARDLDLTCFGQQPRVLQYARLSRLAPVIVEHASTLSLAYSAVSNPDARSHVAAPLVRQVARAYPEAEVPEISTGPDQVWRWYDGEARCLAHGVPGLQGVGVDAAYRYLRANLLLLSLADVSAEVAELLHEQVARLEVWRFRSTRPRMPAS